MIKVKRIYDPPDPSDGVRVLVDRLWPRGMRIEKARIDEWLKEIAPTNVLRTWFAHDPRKWDEFRIRYRREIEAAGKESELYRLRGLAKRGTVTLLYAARDEKRNNAIALKGFIEDAMRKVA